MNPFCLLPICVGIFWLLHASLRILGREEAKYTAWLLLAGLPVMAVAFFLTGMAAEDPNPSRSSSGIAGGGLAEAGADTGVVRAGLGMAAGEIAALRAAGAVG